MLFHVPDSSHSSPVHSFLVFGFWSLVWRLLLGCVVFCFWCCVCFGFVFVVFVFHARNELD